MRKRGFEIISTYKDKNINLPSRKTAKSAGYDLEAGTDVLIEAGKTAIIPTGLKAYMLDDEYLGIHIRSSLAFKKHLNLINAQGIIDADYYNNPNNEGHAWLKLQNEGDKDYVVKKGDAICQGIFTKFLTVDNEEKIINERKGGLGSTNKEEK